MAEYISFQPSDFFNTVLYTGTGTSTTFTGVGFQGDFWWGKQWEHTRENRLFDSVRGAGYYLSSNSNAAQSAEDTDTLSAWTSDGFTLGSDNVSNVNTGLFVSWNWKAGTTSGLSGGTITPSSYSFNATSGFGIYKYVGTGSTGTIAHGLGAVPGMVIVKDLENTDNWITYHAGLGSGSPGGAYVNLDTTGTESTGNTSKWNGTAPTDTVFSLGDAGDTNQSSTDFIAYVFADTKGYSKFGSYTGNGLADGPFIYTGFRPAFVMIKSSSGTSQDWKIIDDKRSTYNVTSKSLAANTTVAEVSSYDICDFNSNGFKLRSDRNEYNGATTYDYIYMAFAEFPLVSSNDVAGVAS